MIILLTLCSASTLQAQYPQPPKDEEPLNGHTPLPFDPQQKSFFTTSIILYHEGIGIEKGKERYVSFIHIDDRSGQITGHRMFLYRDGVDTFMVRERADAKNTIYDKTKYHLGKPVGGYVFYVDAYSFGIFMEHDGKIENWGELRKVVESKLTKLTSG